MNIINSNSIIILEKVQIYGIVKKKKKCVLGLWWFWLGRKGGECKMEDKKCEILMIFFFKVCGENKGEWTRGLVDFST